MQQPQARVKLHVVNFLQFHGNHSQRTLVPHNRQLLSTIYATLAHAYPPLVAVLTPATAAAVVVVVLVIAPEGLAHALQHLGLARRRQLRVVEQAGGEVALRDEVVVGVEAVKLHRQSNHNYARRINEAA